MAEQTKTNPEKEKLDTLMMLQDFAKKQHETQLNPYQQGVMKGLIKAGQEHATEALQQGVPHDHIAQESGVALNNIQQQAQQIVQPATSGIGKFFESAGFGSQTKGRQLDNLAKAQEIISGNASGITPESLAAYNKSLEDAGLTDYQGVGTSTGGIVPHPKPSSENDMVISLKEQQQQDRIENQAIQRITNLRGDASMAKVELQRDASITAYNAISDIKKENRLPSQVEYYDILGQLWKARTGSSPTDQSLRDLDAKTFQGNLAKAAQYFTGKPAGITTKDILNNIQSFVKKSGEQADRLHEGYMKSHLIKPKGLDEERWKNIVETNRGTSFKDATSSSDNVKSGLTPDDEDFIKQYEQKYGGG